jgi:hypothetical protein
MVTNCLGTLTALETFSTMIIQVLISLVITGMTASDLISVVGSLQPLKQVEFVHILLKISAFSSRPATSPVTLHLIIYYVYPNILIDNISNTLQRDCARRCSILLVEMVCYGGVEGSVQDKCMSSSKVSYELKYP